MLAKLVLASLTASALADPAVSYYPANDSAGAMTDGSAQLRRHSNQSTYRGSAVKKDQSTQASATISPNATEDLSGFAQPSLLRGGASRAGWTWQKTCCSKYQVRTESYQTAQGYLNRCLQYSHCTGWTKEWLTGPGEILVYCQGGCEATLPKSNP